MSPPASTLKTPRVNSTCVVVVVITSFLRDKMVEDDRNKNNQKLSNGGHFNLVERHFVEMELLHYSTNPLET